MYLWKWSRTVRLGMPKVINNTILSFNKYLNSMNVILYFCVFMLDLAFFDISKPGYYK